MKQYEVYPVFQDRELSKKWNKIVDVPGSKSITNRALLIAALAQGESELEGVLFSDDSRYFLQCLKSLGFELEIEEEKAKVRVHGEAGRIPFEQASIYVGSAGTAARFLTAMLGLSKGKYFIDASQQMRKRPMKSLLDALRELGADVTFEEKKDYFPFTIGLQQLRQNQIAIDIEKSSQFLSALLMSCVILNQNFEIQVIGSHGMTYIDMTVRIMQEFGCQVQQPERGLYQISRESCYGGRHYQIEPDVSAAAYFYGMAALSGGSVMVRHVHMNSMQGDIRFLKILEEMGCILQEKAEGIQLSGPSDGILHGIDVDMSNCSDQTMTLAAIAPFADSTVRIRNVGHIRLQESNRMEAVQHELTKLGVSCVIEGDDIIIEPTIPHGGLVETYEDHRMAMAFSLIGLRVPGIVIDNPLCCKKTFETYFDYLDKLCGKESQV
ncbi:MAG: 3-phosphoshikimate 1-carboxyvinyltransferase [Lachnospiraceae bacterium]